MLCGLNAAFRSVKKSILHGFDKRKKNFLPKEKNYGPTKDVIRRHEDPLLPGFNEHITMEKLKKMKAEQLSKICEELDIPSLGSKPVLRSRILAMQQSVNYRNFGPRKGRGLLGHKVVCCVPGCSNFSGQILPDGHEVSLHPLPTGPKRTRLRTEWKRRLVNADVHQITDNIRVCSTHFANRVMNVDSIPTIFPRKLDRIVLPDLEILGLQDELEVFSPKIKKRKCRRLYFKRIYRDSPRNESFPGQSSRVNWL